MASPISIRPAWRWAKNKPVLLHPCIIYPALAVHEAAREFSHQTRLLETNCKLGCSQHVYSSCKVTDKSYLELSQTDVYAQSNVKHTEYLTQSNQRCLLHLRPDLAIQQIHLRSTLSLICTTQLTSGPTADGGSDKIISGAEVEVSGNLQTSVVVEDPALFGAVVTVLHRRTVAAVLQTAEGQTWLGDDVEEGTLLQRAGGGGGAKRETWWWKYTADSHFVIFLQFIQNQNVSDLK